MCFSVSASFGAGIILSLVGVATIRKTTSTSQIALAIFPFIFAVQQFAEGFVWLSVLNPDNPGWQSIPIYIFLICSHIVWPILMPVCMLMLEENATRKTVLWVLLSAGVLVGTYHAFLLLTYPVITRVDQHHIQYIIRQEPGMRILSNLLYAISAVLPSLVSGVKRMWWLGAFLFISYVASYLFFKHYVISVWCYFATFQCILVYLVLKEMNKSEILRGRPLDGFFLK